MLPARRGAIRTNESQYSRMNPHRNLPCVTDNATDTALHCNDGNRVAKPNLLDTIGKLCNLTLVEGAVARMRPSEWSVTLHRINYQQC